MRVYPRSDLDEARALAEIREASGATQFAVTFSMERRQAQETLIEDTEIFHGMPHHVAFAAMALPNGSD